jgi:hypothetical protein
MVPGIVVADDKPKVEVTLKRDTKQPISDDEIYDGLWEYKASAPRGTKPARYVEFTTDYKVSGMGGSKSQTQPAFLLGTCAPQSSCIKSAVTALQTAMQKQIEKAPFLAGPSSVKTSLTSICNDHTGASKVLTPPPAYWEDVTYCVDTNSGDGAVYVTVLYMVSLTRNPSSPYQVPSSSDMESFGRNVRKAYTESIKSACASLKGTVNPVFKDTFLTSCILPETLR